VRELDGVDDVAIAQTGDVPAIEASA
jgi:hypothetical protein